MTTRRYRAFISYSHRDAEWGEWLQTALEKYKLPKDMVGRESSAGVVPENLRPIFRDRLDLSAGPSLQAKLDEALEASGDLIVICSPSSAASEYVNEEVRRFKAIGKADRILALIVDGIPGDPEQDCFPEALRRGVNASGAFTEEVIEPVGADVRPEADGKTLAKLKIISGLLGLDLDTLRRREEIAERRRKRVLIAVATSMAVLAVVASATAVLTLVLLQKNQSLVIEQVKMLDGTLRRATELVDQSVTYSRREGVPATMPREILEQVELMFKDLVETDLGRNHTVLKAREAIMALRISENRGFLGKTAQREQYIRRAVEVLEPLLEADGERRNWHSDLAWGYTELGVVYRTKGNLKQAEEAIRKGFEIRQELATRDPDNWGWRRSLSNSYAQIGDIQRAQGDIDAASASYQTALELKTELAASAAEHDVVRNELAGVHIKIGLLKQAWRDAVAAEAQFTKALEIRHDLTTENPLDAYWKRDLSVVQEHLGDLYLTREDIATARRWYDECFDVRKRLARSDETNVIFQSDLAFAYSKFGEVFRAEKNWDKALSEHQKALAIRQKLHAGDEINAEWRYNLGLSHRRIGVVLLAAGKPDEALPKHLEQQAILRTLVEEDGSNLLWQSDLVYNRYEVGKLQASLGRHAEARDEFDAAAVIAERLAPIDAGFGVSYELLFELLRQSANLSAVLGDAGKELAARLAAESTARRLAGMHPEQYKWQANIAKMLEEIGRIKGKQDALEDAAAAFEESLDIREGLVKLDPNNLKWAGNLALRYLRTGQFYRANQRLAEALAKFSRGLEVTQELLQRDPENSRGQKLLKGFTEVIAQLKSQAAAQ